jgi:serine/threonine-protein kinase
VKRLGFYEVLGKLGEGGMGTVYRAKDRRNDQVVAVKLLSPQLRQDVNARKRFLREGVVGRRIAHPNVVAVHDVGEVHLPSMDRTLYLAMELVSGRDLHQRLSFEELDQSMVVDLGAQIAEGLAAAHSAGVVHRDLKPGNVLVSSDGSAKLLDFGLAQVEDQEYDRGLALDEVPAGATQRGMVIGSLGYAAPEQLESSRVDPRADLFSLGVVLFQILTGRLPYPGTSHFDVLAAMEKVRQRLAEPPRPSSLSPWIAPPLDELVASLLDLDRESRPASAAQVAAELRRILDSEDETLQLPSKESEGTEAGSGGRLRRLVQRARDLFGE